MKPPATRLERDGWVLRKLYLDIFWQVDMDTLFIKGLQLSTTIGCLQWERQILQTVVLSLELGVVLGLGDEISETVDYAQLVERLTGFVRERKCQLIETLVQDIAQFIHEQYPLVNLIKVCLEKPGALAKAQTVGVMIERSYV